MKSTAAVCVLDESGSESGSFSPAPESCVAIFACIKRSALSRTPEELAQLLIELEHARNTIALIQAQTAPVL
jgi:hypothetical protein